MGAKISYIFASESDNSEFYRNAFFRVAPEVISVLGVLKSYSIHDTISDHFRESVIGGDPEKCLPENVAENEIFAIYSENVEDGCIMLTSEGRFKVITIALRRVSNPLDFLIVCWKRIGLALCVALMGEELEVSEQELESIVQNSRIPKEMDLCEAAIISARLEPKSTKENSIVDHGAVLVFAKRKGRE